MQKESESGQTVLDRVMHAYAVKTLPALASAIGEKLPTVKSWKQRGAVPLDALIKVATDANCSVDHLLGLPAARTSSNFDRNRHAGGSVETDTNGATSAHLVASAHLLTAQEERAVYAARELVPRHRDAASDIAHLRGLDPGEPERAHALLPVTHDDERPLVLTLEVPGGRRDWEVIPMYLDAASAGTVGAPEATGPPHAEREIDKAGDLAMTQRWITRNLGFARGPLRSVDVLGDSMFPTLQDSETIIVDEGAVEEPVDGIYVIDLYGRRLVKRLQFKLDGSIVLISDNEKYEREVISRGQARDIQLVGRMVWPRVR